MELGEREEKEGRRGGKGAMVNAIQKVTRVAAWGGRLLPEGAGEDLPKNRKLCGEEKLVRRKTEAHSAKGTASAEAPS